MARWSVPPGFRIHPGRTDEEPAMCRMTGENDDQAVMLRITQAGAVHVAVFDIDDDDSPQSEFHRVNDTRGFISGLADWLGLDPHRATAAMMMETLSTRRADDFMEWLCDSGTTTTPAQLENVATITPRDAPRARAFAAVGTHPDIPVRIRLSNDGAIQTAISFIEHGRPRVLYQRVDADIDFFAQELARWLNAPEQSIESLFELLGESGQSARQFSVWLHFHFPQTSIDPAEWNRP